MNRKENSKTFLLYSNKLPFSCLRLKIGTSIVRLRVNSIAKLHSIMCLPTPLLSADPSAQLQILRVHHNQIRVPYSCSWSCLGWLCTSFH